MEKRKYFRIYFIICMLLSYSCSSILETNPESLITVNTFWQTKEDARGGLYGMYVQFREFAGINLILVGEARSETMGHGIQNAAHRIKYFENSLDAENADLNWQQMYRTVNYANLIIKYVPDIPFTDEAEKNAIIAQGYAMRAYMYFVMAKTWGDLPLVLEPIEGFDAGTIYKERTSVNEIFDFIKEDVNKADALFAGNAFNASRSIWSRPALNMLKAEVYLWTGKRLNGGEADITVALEALNEAASADVTLLDDYASIFDYDNKGNKEVILAVNYKDLEASNNYYADMYINPNDINPSIDEDTKAIIGTGGGYNWWAPSSFMRNQFSGDDQRKDGSFLEIYRHENGTDAYVTTIVTKGKGFVDGGVRKFLSDVIIYRYADLLLMKAEAKNALGQDPSEEINAIRERAYAEKFAEHEFVNGTPAENDETILQERLFEFAFEGKRWWDLIRFDKVFDKVPSLQGRQQERYLLLWPITAQTISLNSNVKQNPEY